ncbi:FAD/NAD-P-binding domain-containing protein [Panaeolus papilionaceus]|nr:FAD/NAD-P-binding domain-containing protein [Panaeolus papilionaceus]
MINTSHRPNIVVIGGGGCGAQVARRLSEKLDHNKYNLILVTARPYYTHLPAWIRMSVTDEGHLEHRAHMTYNYLFKDGKGSFVVGKVASINTQEGTVGGVLMMESGETLEYEVCILTPGSIWPGPLNIPDTKETTEAHLRDWRHKFDEANDIVLVGGGAVALEYSGEIKDKWPDKRVTIVHGDNLLLNDAYPKYFRRDVAKDVRKRGVDLILNDWVDDMTICDASTIETRNGRKLIADLVVSCTGPKPNTGFVTLKPGTLSETNHIRVSATLQVFSYPHLFAGGDAIEWDEQKQVSKYSSHANVIAHNVIQLLAKKQPSALYPGSFELISISNGRNGGSSYWSIFWGPTFGDFISATVKSKDLFLSYTRKSLGLSS